MQLGFRHRNQSHPSQSPLGFAWQYSPECWKFKTAGVPNFRLVQAGFGSWFAFPGICLQAFPPCSPRGARGEKGPMGRNSTTGPGGVLRPMSNPLSCSGVGRRAQDRAPGGAGTRNESAERDPTSARRTGAAREISDLGRYRRGHTRCASNPLTPRAVPIYQEPL